MPRIGNGKAAAARAALPSNRVASLATFIAGLGGCATALAGFWPNTTTAQIALIAGSVATIAGPLSHVVGSWFWQKTPAGQALALAGTAPASNVADDTTVTPDEWRERRYPNETPATEQPDTGAAPETPPTA